MAHHLATNNDFIYKVIKLRESEIIAVIFFLIYWKGDFFAF